MNKDIEIKYKLETGKSVRKSYETKLLNENVDCVFLEGFTRSEILDFLKHEKPKWGIFLKDLPEEFNQGSNLFLPDTDYINWLEEKVIELQKEHSKFIIQNS